MATLATVSPTEEDLALELKSLRESHPSTGALKLLGVLREARPEWAVSEKRLKKVLQQEGLMVSAGITEAGGSAKIAQTNGQGAATSGKTKKSGKVAKK